ncbi:hypothetical protein P7K49_025055 [Saguinus oedipus]|uniref:Uncharacterized protein n=1 Tax=Saguinus oedipus TaxID=9490 RepID=A0ABQ9UGK2_SAGOE|nr:hypothetical protein P7K49_025055 [Saguinus oedipus]
MLLISWALLWHNSATPVRAGGQIYRSCRPPRGPEQASQRSLMCRTSPSLSQILVGMMDWPIKVAVSYGFNNSSKRPARGQACTVISVGGDAFLEILSLDEVSGGLRSLPPSDPLLSH